LKPGGRIVIADIRSTAVYEETLRALGASNVERHRLGWRFWWGNTHGNRRRNDRVLDHADKESGYASGAPQ
jgi:hypothetical protein